MATHLADRVNCTCSSSSGEGLLSVPYCFVSHCRFFLLFLAVTVLSAAPVQAFVLAKDGMPSCFIVIRNNAPKAERYAAEEMARYLKEMTGAGLPIRETDYNGIPSNGHAVLIGQGDWLALPRFSSSAEDLDIQGPQSYVIKTYADGEPDILLIAGATPRATVYAVIELLSRLGVRWYTPEVTRAPHSATVDPGELDIADFPCFPFRGVSGVILAGSSAEWAARLRLNAGYGFMEQDLDCKPEYISLDIPLGEILSGGDPAARSGLFPLIDGERTGGYDLCCFTNPQTYTVVADSITARVSGNPLITRVVLITDQAGFFCQCDACTQAVRKEGSRPDLLLSWLIRVSDHVARSCPNVTVELLLPRSCSGAPTRQYSLKHAAVRISDEAFARDRPFEDSIDEQVMRYVHDLQGWSKKIETISIVHPAGHQDYPPLPFPDLTRTFRNILMYRDDFVQGLFFTVPSPPGLPAADAEMRSWVIAQLLWNSDQDGSTLVREWIKGVYGMSWGPMLDYWRHIGKLTVSSDSLLTVHADPAGFITDEWLDTADRIIQRGYAQSMTDSTAHRYVRKARLGVWFARLLRTKRDIESGAAPSAGKQVDAVVALLEQWEKEMAALGFNRISEKETVDEFAGSLRKLLGKK